MTDLAEWLEQNGPLTPYAAADLVTQVAVLLRGARERGVLGSLTTADVTVTEVDDALRARLGDLRSEQGLGDVQALGRLLAAASAGIAPTDPGADWLVQVLARSSGAPDARYPDLSSMLKDLRAAVVGIAAGVAVESTVGVTPVVSSVPAPGEPVRTAAPPPAAVPARRGALLPVLLLLAVVLVVVLVVLLG